jgi:hypothetical protein
MNTYAAENATDREAYLRDIATETEQAMDRIREYRRSKRVTIHDGLILFLKTKLTTLGDTTRPEEEES